MNTTQKLKEAERKVELLRAALDQQYTEANKHAGDFPKLVAHIAEKALRATDKKMA